MIRKGAHALGLLLVVGIFAGVGSHYAVYGMLGPDESYQAMAAREAMDGRLPYGDFAYLDMPLLPYLTGLVMEVAGYDLMVQRVVNLTAAGLGVSPSSLPSGGVWAGGSRVTCSRFWPSPRRASSLSSPS